MFPVFPFQNKINSCDSNIEFFGQSCLTTKTNGTATDIQNLFARNLTSTFLITILDIFSVCSKPQMIGVNTMANVATMAYMKSFWNRAFMDLIALSMSRSLASINHYTYAITFIIFKAYPQPTSISFKHFIPKSFHAFSIAQQKAGV